MILKVVKQRVEAAYEKDLVQMILEGAKNSADNSALLHKNFIVDNCKTLFFAGHDTTALATSWALTLLAAHPDWQARACAEVLEICRDKPLDADMLRSMKVVCHYASCQC
ncbi:cytochrome P450 714C2-like [Pyrus ussuriensis x Pyrus communis]|uniref:Cytochrome P450 714C2-like n=1 Tax=Pyrus ussuriensis x Pyrus communis TaxID=2448454 RepID=A0A5N5G4C4_9ROSA|nr:cytochrome P450 714C2-like [Pyrus ussuriensis x Pyrus communis]